MDARELVTVKISSEAAGYISITQVVVQQMPLIELVETILGVTGKHTERVRETLRLGVLVAGGARYRWQGWEEDAGSIRGLLEAFPDSDPSRAFREDLCLRAVLSGPRCRVEIPRKIAAARPLLRGRSFWDALMAMAGAAQPHYVEYSYRQKADCFHVDLDRGMNAVLLEAAKLLCHRGLRVRVASGDFDRIELHAAR
ncbi:MAG: hypothetical protein LLG20_03325 [Acidobacteriales bacterium]|nr:hypothetical protein [Terriglobales bacterium]